VSRYQKGKTNLDSIEARDSEWQWHQLGHMQVCTLLQTNNHASDPPLSFLQAGCPSCRPTNSVKTLKAACYAMQSDAAEYNTNMVEAAERSYKIRCDSITLPDVVVSSVACNEILDSH